MEKSIDEQILELKKAIEERKAGTDLPTQKEYKGIPLTSKAGKRATHGRMENRGRKQA